MATELEGHMQNTIQFERARQTEEQRLAICVMVQDRSITSYCPMLVQEIMNTDMKFLSWCQPAGHGNHYTLLAQPAGMKHQHTPVESTDFHGDHSLDMYSAADNLPSHAPHRNMSVLSMSHGPTRMCPKQTLPMLSLWRRASWRLAEATYARYNKLYILARTLTAVTGSMKAQCNHLLHACVAGIALTCQAATAGLAIVWITTAVCATALHTTNASTQPCRLRAPMLVQIAQCIAYIIWLLAKIIMEVMFETHCVAVLYTAIMFAVHGFLLPHHPSWNISTICVGIQKVLILCIMTWHSVGAINPVTKIIMQAVLDTLQLMAPNNKTSCRQPIHSPPKFRNGRYWRRIRYSKRRFQRQPLCKLMTFLSRINRKLYHLDVYLHTNCYMQHVYARDEMMQTQSVCTTTQLYL